MCPLVIRLKLDKRISFRSFITFLLIAFSLFMHRKTSDVPEHHREEGEMVIPSYGYFIRGAQTTFSGVLRFVNTSLHFTSLHLELEVLSVVHLCQNNIHLIIDACIVLLAVNAFKIVFLMWELRACFFFVFFQRFAGIGSGSTSCAEWQTLIANLKTSRLHSSLNVLIDTSMLNEHINVTIRAFNIALTENIYHSLHFFLLA